MLKYLNNQQKNQVKRLEKLNSYVAKDPSELNSDQLKSIEEIPRIEFYLGKLSDMLQLMELEESTHLKSVAHAESELKEVNQKLELRKKEIEALNAAHTEQFANVNLVKDTLSMIFRLYNKSLSEADLTKCQRLERSFKLNDDFTVDAEALAIIKDIQYELIKLYRKYFKGNDSLPKSELVGSSWQISEGQSMFTKTQLPPILDKSTLLVHFTGPHGTDIIHACFDGLAQLSSTVKFNIKDINIHRAWHDVQVMLCLNVLKMKSEDLINKFDELAEKWHGQYHVQILNDSEYQFDSAPYPGRNKYMITVLDSNVNTKSKMLSSLADFIKICLAQKISIEVMRSLNKSHTAWDIRVSSMDPFFVVRKSLFTSLKPSPLDVAITPLSVYRKQRRLIVFDMDSTLIQEEVIDELAREYNVYDKVQEITHLAMQGKLPFSESLQQRVSMLKNAPIEIIDKVKNRIQLTNGAKELCALLKRLGFQICVLSGGFEPFIQHIQTILPIDHYFANKFVYKYTSDGYVIDGVDSNIVDAQRKADLLKIMAQAHHLNPQQVIAIGDGSNDIPMLKTAGLGIAFKAKAVVQQEIESKLSGSLLDVMYLMGYHEDEINELLKQVQLDGLPEKPKDKKKYVKKSKKQNKQ